MKILTITYIVSAIALSSLALGIIIMIVVRVDPIPKWKTVCKVLIWVIGLLIFRLVFWGLVKLYQEKKVQPAVITKNNVVSEKTVISKKILFDYYFKLPNGVYVNGRNEVAPDERTLEVVRWDDNYLWLNQYYVEYGHPETMRIRLQRVCNKSWEGTWEQDRPENHGRMTLTEVNPNTFLGEQTWKDGERASCHITRTK